MEYRRGRIHKRTADQGWTVDPSYRTGIDLTDQQRTIIEPLFEEKRRPDDHGRPWRDARLPGRWTPAVSS
jgi:hypothetical protein